MEFITENFTVISVWIGFISAWYGAAKLGFKLKQAIQQHDATLKNELKKALQEHGATLKNEFQEHDALLKEELKNEFQEHDVILKNEINQLEARRNIRIGELDAKVQRILQILKK